MGKRKFPWVCVLLIVIAVICLCGFIVQSRGNAESYVRLDGKYYYFIGATVNPDAVGEEIAAVERRVPRNIFNREGDSNFTEPGAKIYKPVPEVAAESGDTIYVELTLIYVHDDRTEEEKTEYAIFEAE